MKTKSCMTDELTEVLQAVKWTSIIDGLTPTSTFTIDPQLEVFSDIYIEAGYDDFITMLRKSIYTIMEQKYNDIDVPETLSNLLGKGIKKISKNKVEFSDGQTVDTNDLDYNVIKPLIWWSN